MFAVIKTYFLLFIFYSIVGWIVEVARCYLKNHKFINRGFLIGPYCPIYGVGALMIHLIYSNFFGSIVVVFITSIINAALLEYVTSYLMEKIFGARWWDYSDRKFNINGRVCVENLIGFGVLSLIALYITNPLFFKILDKVPTSVTDVIFIFSAIGFLIDYVLSLFILGSIKKSAKKIKTDDTEKMHQLVLEMIKAKSWRYRRIFNAHPGFQFFRIEKKRKKP